MKRAEDGEGTIVRLYEASGAAQSVRFTCFRKLSRIEETNLMERTLRVLEQDVEGVELSLHAFEIRTLRLVL